MFDIGLSEILLIAAAAIIFIGPKDLPIVMRHVMKFIRELRMLYLGLKKQMHDVMEEAGLNDLHHDLNQNVTTIIDLEGKPQKAYNIEDLKQLEQTRIVPSEAPVMEQLPPREKP